MVSSAVLVSLKFVVQPVTNTTSGNFELNSGFFHNCDGSFKGTEILAPLVFNIKLILAMTGSDFGFTFFSDNAAEPAKSQIIYMKH